MTQKKENSAQWTSDWWTHTSVMELELNIWQTVLKEEGDKPVKLSNCPHEVNSKSHSCCLIWDMPHPGDMQKYLN